ncbi:MAG: GTP pyrophosphokinase family protein, partial [Lachnospiraceae bacterium]|nr:GTP pyrophosphokinase family protein [Lachnospiraceae bacterium]
METNSIYGPCEEYLPLIMKKLTDEITAFNEECRETTGHPVYEHFLYRIKEDKSMREKCTRKGFPVTT